MFPRFQIPTFLCVPNNFGVIEHVIAFLWPGGRKEIFSNRTVVNWIALDLQDHPCGRDSVNRQFFLFLEVSGD